MSAEAQTIDQQFADFEKFAEAVRCYDVVCRQLGPGKFHASATQVVTENALLSGLSANRGLEAAGSPPQGMLTFGMPTVNCQPFAWRNRKTDANSVQFYRPQTELLVNTHGNFDAIDLSLTEQHLLTVAETLDIKEPEKLICQGRMVNCAEPRMASLRRTSATLIKMVFASALPGNEARTSHLMEFILPALLLRTLEEEHGSAQHSPPRKSLRAFLAAKAYINHNIESPVSISDLCNLTNTSDRTLQKIFLQITGIGPKAYIRTVRLNRIHTDLLNAKPGTITVTDAANRYGFWHMGQFAADYRLLFGELPSETLRKINPA